MSHFNLSNFLCQDGLISLPLRLILFRGDPRRLLCLGHFHSNDDESYAFMMFYANKINNTAQTPEKQYLFETSRESLFVRQGGTLGTGRYSWMQLTGTSGYL